MRAQLCFFASVTFGFIAWSVVAGTYIWPRLRGMRRADAPRPILILHSFRFLGLACLVPGVVSPDLPAAFARPDAYGDIVAASLALPSLGLLKRRTGLAVAWIFNLWGTADLLSAFYHGNSVDLGPGQLGATYFIPTLFVPLLLITHGLAFSILLRHEGAAATHGKWQPRDLTGRAR